MESVARTSPVVRNFQLQTFASSSPGKGVRPIVSVYRLSHSMANEARPPCHCD